MRMRVPSGKIAGSAATIPFETGMPDAVMLPVQYAVAVNRRGAVGPAGASVAGASVAGACVAGGCGGGTSDGGSCGGGS
jgi:hypothetical protein